MFRRSAVLFVLASTLFALVAQGCSSESITNPVAAETSFARAASSSVAVEIMVSPSMIVLKEEGNWVTVHAVLPYSSVEPETVALNGVPAALTFADDCGDLVAKFELEDICAIVAPPEATLTLTGVTTGGEIFEGIDTVRVMEKGGQ
jgi:hypothetical protein